MVVTPGNGIAWEASEVAAERYPAGVAGRDAWVALVGRLQAQAAEDAWGQFLSDLAVEPKAARPERVFVSHQRKDVKEAERLAYLATQAGLQYWLDIHDPTLTWANGLAITGPPRAVLIAGIIEIALLNCRYVVALHTTNSLGSKWIPYEFARVKDHIPFSDDVAGWFAPSVQAGLTEDYCELGRKTYGEGQAATAPTLPWNRWQPVADWLRARGGGGGARPPLPWLRPPVPLPPLP